MFGMLGQLEVYAVSPTRSTEDVPRCLCCHAFPEQDKHQLTGLVGLTPLTNLC